MNLDPRVQWDKLEFLVLMEDKVNLDTMGKMERREKGDLMVSLEKMECLVQGVLQVPLVALELMVKMVLRELVEKMVRQENLDHQDLLDLLVVRE